MKAYKVNVNKRGNFFQFLVNQNQKQNQTKIKMKTIEIKSRSLVNIIKKNITKQKSIDAFGLLIETLSR